MKNIITNHIINPITQMTAHIKKVESINSEAEASERIPWSVIPKAINKVMTIVDSSNMFTKSIPNLNKPPKN